MSDSAIMVGGVALAAPSDVDGTIARFTDPYGGGRLSQRELLKHTRISALVHDVVGSCLEAYGAFLPEAAVIGIVSASLYGCVSATELTRSSFRKGGVLGIDPMHFAKATHNFPTSAISMAYGFRGPGTAFVGRRNAWIDAVGFSSALIRQDMADAIVVISFDEIDECVDAHLSASGYFNHEASTHIRCVAECCNAIVLVSPALAMRVPGNRRYAVRDWKAGSADGAMNASRFIRASTEQDKVVAALDASPAILVGMDTDKTLRYRISTRDYLGATSAQLAIEWLQQADNATDDSCLSLLSIDDKGSCSSIMLQPVLEVAA